MVMTYAMGILFMSPNITSAKTIHKNLVYIFHIFLLKLVLTIVWTLNTKHIKWGSQLT
jgi:hypothetical protein